MAGPRLRAGLTDVLEIGIDMIWIAVRVRPMAAGARRAGPFALVTPMMTTRKNAVSTVSRMNTSNRLALSIESSP